MKVCLGTSATAILCVTSSSARTITYRLGLRESSGLRQQPRHTKLLHTPKRNRMSVGKFDLARHLMV